MREVRWSSAGSLLGHKLSAKKCPKASFLLYLLRCRDGAAVPFELVWMLCVLCLVVLWGFPLLLPIRVSSYYDALCTLLGDQDHNLRAQSSCKCMLRTGVSAQYALPIKHPRINSDPAPGLFAGGQTLQRTSRLSAFVIQLLPHELCAALRVPIACREALVQGGLHSGRPQWGVVFSFPPENA